MANVLDYEFEIYESELQLLDNGRFWINIQLKGINPRTLSISSLLNSITAVLLQGCLSYQITHEKQNKTKQGQFPFQTFGQIDRHI